MHEQAAVRCIMEYLLLIVIEYSLRLKLYQSTRWWINI